MINPAYVRALLVAALAAASASSQVSVVTGQYDANRDSANPAEIVLNTSNVNPTQFGLLFSLPVDGFIYAQPLYVPAVTIQGTTQNVVYAATTNNSVYAFNADDPEVAAPLWQVNLGPTVADPGPRLLNSNIGILSTPVIDPVAGILYVVAFASLNSVPTYQLHALDITSGQELLGGPMTIQATVPGTAPDSVNGQLAFNAAIEWQRPALLLNNGIIYVAFGTGVQETNTYHGWVLEYNASNLQPLGAICVTPNGSGGGVWMSGYGLAADMNGVYYVSGNGDFDGIANWGETVVALDMDGIGIANDWFTPSEYATLNTNDWDLGTTGAVLLPNTNLLVVGGKDGELYLLDRGNLGGLENGNTQIVQSFLAAAGCTGTSCSQLHHFAVWARSSSPTLMYSWASKDVLKGFSFSDMGMFNTAPFATGILTSGSPGGTLALSSNGETAGSAILWSTMSTGNAITSLAPGTLYAYDAGTLLELWDSGMNPADTLGNYAKFSTPTVANGKTYVATFSNQLNVYGLRTLSTANLNFPSQVTNTVSTAQTVVFTNGTTLPMATPGITARGDFAASSTCASPIAPGASCAISVTFTPTAAGTRTGAVTVTDSAVDSPQTISLTGTGVIGITFSLFKPGTEGGASKAGNTITLSSAAPDGGAVITLSSSNPLVASVPSTITVPAGATVSAPFTITTGAVSSQTKVTFTATYSTSVQTANFTVIPAVLYNVYLVPSTTTGGLSTSANQVSLYGQAAGSGDQVALLSSNPAVASVPATVLVPSGISASQPFTIGTTGVAVTTTVSISAIYQGTTKSVNLTVLPASLSQVTLPQKWEVGGGTLSSSTVALLGQAPPGGALISLASANPSVAAVPASVTVPAGSSVSPSFSITTSIVGTTTVVPISATYMGVTKVVNFTVFAATVYKVVLSADNVAGGTTLRQNRVVLTGDAPAGGLVITLSSSNSGVANPAQTITVPAGSANGFFAIPTTAVTVSTPVTITASYGGTTVSTVLTVTP